MYLNFIRTMALLLAVISEDKVWKNMKSYIHRNDMILEHAVTVMNKYMAAAEAINFEQQMPLKRSKRQIAEAEMQAYAAILTVSAVLAVIIAFVCLIILLHIFIYMRWGITRRLIILNAKICALESRLGTRQMSEELQKRLCEEIGAKYEAVQNERQKFVQTVVNEERKMVEEVVKSENEAQYDTMRGIGDEVFASKRGKTRPATAAALVEAEPVVAKKAAEEEHHYENVPKEAKKAAADAEPGYEIYTGDKVAKPTEGPKVDPNIQGSPMVDMNDPKYQTLVGMDNEKVFSARGGGATQDTQEIRPPQVGGMVDTEDPNYQTLVGMDNTKIFQKKS